MPLTGFRRPADRDLGDVGPRPYAVNFRVLRHGGHRSEDLGKVLLPGQQ
jgi:hypothetical protein